MSYRRLETIAQATWQFTDEARWRCACEACGGNTVDLIATENEAAIHSLLALAGLAQVVLQDPGVARRAWLERCRHSVSVNREIADALKSNWSVPGFLDAWLTVPA